ncbi:mediator of RNA polymerase II transcription subunit 9 [Hyalella azteca]|uniref:Mediator of RNA polymerase II transcription subunit 9 n=1 Tax=Hyalella azteca TaxID=294128 RepID=A0A979FYK9_HYAAZ|nr:mediator of RNA polymerase II transcription subunit 9 [Hyalella azteca]
MSIARSTVTAEEIDLDFLPIIYQFMRCLEKEQNQTDLNRVAVEASQRLSDLQNKISLAREQVPKLAGVENSPAEQLKKLDALRAQLTLKKKLLSKYKAEGASEPNSA